MIQLLATSLITAILVMALTHRGRRYVSDVEQRAMNQEVELLDLQRVNRQLRLRVENETFNTAGAHNALLVERVKTREAQNDAIRAHQNATAMAVRLAIAEARAPELHLVDSRV